jgi:uncharacterized protein (DUF433 family)
MNTAISSNAEIMGGTPCLTGTRVPFQTLLDRAAILSINF